MLNFNIPNYFPSLPKSFPSADIQVIGWSNHNGINRNGNTRIRL